MRSKRSKARLQGCRVFYVRARERSASLFFRGKFEVRNCIQWVVRVLMIVIDLFQDQTKAGFLDIQLAMRLSWCPRIVGLWTTTRTAALTTRYGPFFPGLRNMGSGNGSPALLTGRLINTPSILDSVRITQLTEEFLLVLSCWAISRTRGNSE